VIKAITLIFPDGRQLNWDFDFSLQGTMRLGNMFLAGVPDWVKLEFCQCPACTLDPEVSPTCPVAEVLAQYAYELANRKSFEQVRVEIYQKDAGKLELNDIALQTIVGELVRLGVFQYQCPVGRKVKPAMTKLPPFPSNEQILQAFAEGFAEHHEVDSTELDDEGNELLDAIHDLFGNLSNRLDEVGEGDAHLNGVVILHSLSVLFSLSAPELIQDILMKENSETEAE
jgi:hypothetical protein